MCWVIGLENLICILYNNARQERSNLLFTRIQLQSFLCYVPNPTHHRKLIELLMSLSVLIFVIYDMVIRYKQER